MAVPKNHEKVLEFFEQCEIIEGIIHSPELFKKDTRDRPRSWQIFVELFDESENTIISIIPRSITNRIDIAPEHVARYYTKTGIIGGKQTITDYKVIREGKYIGKSNYTTALTQALSEAQSEYVNKCKAGFQPAGEHIREETPGEKVESEKYPFPMALHIYDKHKERLQFPCYIQPKLDGVMAVYYPGKQIFYTRAREPIVSFPGIVNELIEMCEATPPGLFIVGELYKHGLPLQKISGYARKQTPTPEADVIQFCIFDCFDINSPGLGFESRQILLKKILPDAPTPGLDMSSGRVQLLLTELVKNSSELTAAHDKYVAAGYEGAVIRNINAKYEFSFNSEKRSFEALKYKLRYDAEWPVVNYTCGERGKDSGAVIWICETKTGIQFNVVPNASLETRKAIYTYLETTPEAFEKIIRGKLLRVNYSELSTDGVPLQPKGLVFIEPETQITLDMITPGS